MLRGGQAKRESAAESRTLGLLEQAAVRGLIDLPQAIDRLRQTNARLDSGLIEAVLERRKGRENRNV